MQKFLLVLGFILASVVPIAVSAHGFGQRIDLPVPLYLYLFGAVAIVALSFILLGFLSGRFTNKLFNYPSLNLSRFGLVRVVLSAPIIESLKFLSLTFFLVALASGIWGNQNPAFNMLPTVVWVIFGIGVPLFSAFIGDIWKVINPIKILFEYLERIIGRLGYPLPFREWPLYFGVWPAFVLFFGFRWVENVSLNSAVPQPLAVFVLTYAVIMFVGMLVFGKNQWLSKGDPFSVFFSFLARFSILETRHVDGKKELHLRPPAVGLLKDEAGFSQTAFVLLMLSSVAADGMLGTSFFQSMFSSLLSVGLPWIVIGTFGIVALFVTFTLIYTGFSFLTKIVSSDTEPTLKVAYRFIYSLLPISIAYEIAHYLSVLVIEGQRLLYLISDPFGKGWDLFGTANYDISYTVLNLKTLWNLQVGLIILGHVVAVLISHTIAERYFQDTRRALISQYPMLILMVFYSVLSLWIMAQPIIGVG